MTSVYDPTHDLAEAWARCESVDVTVFGVGTETVYATPKGVFRRDAWFNKLPPWQWGRAWYPVGARSGPLLGHRIWAGDAALPAECAVCLGEPTTGRVVEHYALRPHRGRYEGRTPRVVGAWAGDRTWYVIPYCAAHATHTDAVRVVEGHLVFRNPDYAREFGDLNGIEPRRFIERWWLALGVATFFLLVFSAPLMVAGIGTLFDEKFGVAIVAFVVGTLGLAAGVALAHRLYREVLRPALDRRHARHEERASEGLHRDRGDGYCARCFRPWPCPPARK